MLRLLQSSTRLRLDFGGGLSEVNRGRRRRISASCCFSVSATSESCMRDGDAAAAAAAEQKLPSSVRFEVFSVFGRPRAFGGIHTHTSSSKLCSIGGGGPSIHHLLTSGGAVRARLQAEKQVLPSPCQIAVQSYTVLLRIYERQRFSHSLSSIFASRAHI